MLKSKNKKQLAVGYNKNTKIFNFAMIQIYNKL